jgi:hypothetical protein
MVRLDSVMVGFRSDTNLMSGQSDGEVGHVDDGVVVRHRPDQWTA